MVRNRTEGAAASIRQIAAASLVGTVVEWYDFFLYGTMAALVFNAQFFPTFDPLVGTLIAFATFAAGFITRPIGAVVFGHLGDRLGRKPMLVVTMMIMGGATFLMGVLPNYESIGVAAPVLLLVLRMLQGIGLGGEWGGAILLCAEHAPGDKRGWYSSWPQLGVPLGLLLSVLAVNAVGWFGDDALAAGGWRIPFLASAVLVVLGLFIRLRISEPPAFEKIREDDARSKIPMVEVLRKHPGQVIRGMGARMSESVTFNVYNAFLVTYTVEVLMLDKNIVLDALLIASVVGFFAILAAGRLTDRVGRRPVFAAGAALALVSAFPIFWMVDTKNPVLITIAVVVGWGIAACGMFGAEGILFAELFPTRVRYSGMSIVYQIGVLPSGAIAPLVATSLVAGLHGSWSVALYVMAMALISLVALAFIAETKGRRIDAPEDEPAATPETAQVGRA